ncbi:hypothetical protein MUG87_16010 [Ectobacillus sp. JY-23]|uniref:hypothetical protein n=1 Tax=Ectobacillus sp. JY-23 TaxID=2933872 RepID=UPI001FF38B27|nr:hypothetical protein [Ectobacillus sp. JY-23]UOY91954.1 hypothetical protein MUG87_16010 [Ectobacillus sp. JY-23]
MAVTNDGKYVLAAIRTGDNLYEDKKGIVAVVELETAAEAGLYPDSRSENRGSEVENLTTALIEGSPILAVAAERSNAVLFFDVTFPMFPVYLGLVPSSEQGPEGIHKIQNQNTFVSADEVDGVLTFYSFQK